MTTVQRNWKGVKNKSKAEQHEIRESYAEVRKRGDFGFDNSTHHLLQLKKVPSSVERLRDLLQQPQNSDIHDYAIQGKDFSECVARIATFLDILLDGDYEGGDLCNMLATAMENRHASKAGVPHIAAPGLRQVELVEREGSLTVEDISAGENETTGTDTLHKIN